MSHYRRSVFDSSELSVYKLPARQRNVIENLRYLQSVTKSEAVHIAASDWNIINEALLKQSGQVRSLHNVTLGGVRILAAQS